MIHFFSHLSDITVFIFLSVFTVLFSIFAVYAVKMCVPLHIRLNDNQVIGNTVSLISVIYGVLAGLTALYLINNNSDTSDIVQHEANAIANIYRASKWLHAPASTNIQIGVKNYLDEVINVEWAALKHGDEITHDVNGTQIIDHITEELVRYSSNSDAEFLLVHDILDDIRALSDARQQRIHMSYKQLSPELWGVIVLGAILTLCINYLFGMNIYLHMIIVSAAALITTSMIFLLITLDRPFQGEFAIEPDAFIALQKSVDTYLASENKVAPINTPSKTNNVNRVKMTNLLHKKAG